jgi:UDP-N-acetylglucosamine--N-acetylmuramyl-(pentapeptide) pyrophosphoryl-undecaprenol N-acetylglucosamine transferase
MGPVMVMAGGTGGHVFPALAVARALQEQGADVFWLGSRNGMESRLVPQQGIAIEWIPVEGLRGTGLRRLLRAPLQLSVALLRAFRIMRRRKPAVVLGMGGFAAGPGGLMARLMGIPLVVHEQNQVPGLTNQCLSRIATRVFEAFPGSFPLTRAAIACGNPVRRDIAALAAPEQRFENRRGALRLLVLGGSLGARALNVSVPAALALLTSGQRPQVRHQAGSATLSEAIEAYAKHGVAAEVVAFIDDMAAAYAWADLVIARAGALTVSELAAAGLGAILVPFPHAVDDHQSKNASYLTAAGAALLLPQAELSAPRLADMLRGFGDDRGAALAMARAARGLARLGAAEQVARSCLEVAKL